MYSNMSINKAVKDELERYISIISSMDGVMQIYLYGSYAYGSPTADSDIDLFVIVNDGVDSLKIMQDVSRGIMNRRVSLDVLVDSISDFAELSEPNRVTLQREIKNRGVLVYGQQ
jgi:predicted nucleotidyltransferase